MLDIYQFITVSLNLSNYNTSQYDDKNFNFIRLLLLL